MSYFMRTKVIFGFILMVSLIEVTLGANRSINKTLPSKSMASECLSSWPAPTEVVRVSQPMEITSNFDCQNKLYTCGGDHVFVLSGNAKLSNCFLQRSGIEDGIHVKGSGSVILENIYFLSVGDDGVSIFDDADVTISGGGFHQAGNKAVQHDGSGTVTIKNACFENVHIASKSCGNCGENAQVKGRKMNIIDCSISNVRTVCGVNCNRDDVCTISGLTGTPLESYCTEYDATINPGGADPPQVSKNVKNQHCQF